MRLPDWEKDVEMTVRLLRDPMTVGNISDAGAHGQMFCGAGDNVLLLTEWVRDERRIGLEEATHALTGKLAGHFALTDRGTLELGKRADVAVFDLDEIQHRPKHKVRDVPNDRGGLDWRYSRDPAPMRLTLVDGVATFEDGKATGARPGGIVTPRG